MTAGARRRQFPRLVPDVSPEPRVVDATSGMGEICGQRMRAIATSSSGQRLA